MDPITICATVAAAATAAKEVWPVVAQVWTWIKGKDAKKK